MPGCHPVQCAPGNSAWQDYLMVMVLDGLKRSFSLGHSVIQCFCDHYSHFRTVFGWLCDPCCKAVQQLTITKAFLEKGHRLHFQNPVIFSSVGMPVRDRNATCKTLSPVRSLVFCLLQMTLTFPCTAKSSSYH